MSVPTSNPAVASAGRPDHLVVIGASAGGIEALSLLVASLPGDFPAPVVLAQHLDPTRPSQLGAILGRRTSLQVVDETVPLRPRQIYVVPSNRHVVIRDGHVGAEAAGAERPRPSVDLLLTTAALAYGERLVAVILTGSGSDGASGAIDVKNAGGTVVIQDPRTAAHPAMPLALPPTAVDHVADLEDIGRLLGDILQGAVLGEKLAPTEQDVLTEVLGRITRHAGIDFRQYKPSTILRRIGRRMALNHVRTLADYRDYLEAHPQELADLVRSLLIKVTEFFRDAEAFAVLENEVVPQLVARGRERGRVLRLWSAGCATGEEAYSLALLVATALGDELPEWSVRIFATDADEDAIAFARRGYYPANVLGRLPEGLRDRYLEPAEHGFRVHKSIRGMVIFGQQDLSRGVPFPRIDLVVCRNLLIYFKPELQQDVLDLFAYSLHHTRGFLFLGRAETARPSKAVFELVDQRWKVYRCVGGPLPVPIRPERGELDTLRAMARPAVGAQPGEAPDPVADESELVQIRRANELLLRHLPQGVLVIDRGYTIVSLNPEARRLLGIRERVVGLDFLHAARSLPYREVRSAIDRAFQERSAVALPDLEVSPSPGDVHYLALQVTPTGSNGATLACVTVVDVTELVRTKRRLAAVESEQKQLTDELGSSNRRLTEANQELQDANEELQTANEEMMLAQEELQSTNEEFEATNGELQAINEELETNNEELQATNEELETTNEELQARTSELQELMRTLSTERRRLGEVVELAPFHIVVLRGPGLVIESLNPPSGRLFDGSEFLGRPLEDVCTDPNLESVCIGARHAFVGDRRWSSERLAVATSGIERHYVFSAVPTHGADDEVDGVVLYAEDVTERLARDEQEQFDKLRLMLEHADPIAMALFEAPSGRLVQATTRFTKVIERLRGVPAAGQRSWREVWFGGADAAGSFDEAARTGSPIRFREVRVAEARGVSAWDCSLIPVTDASAKSRVRHIAMTAVEITEPVLARDQLEALDRLKDEFLSLASHELRTPLTPLMAYTEMFARMLDGKSPAPERDREMKGLVAKFRRQIGHMSKLTDDLLDVARLQSGKLALDLQTVSLLAIVREARDQVAASRPEPPIELVVNAPSEPRLNGDPVRLTQVVHNLLVNAVKHGNGVVEVRLESFARDGRSWGRIEVRDGGPGVPAEMRAGLFQRFFQASPRERRESRAGLGLGLYISQGIVEQHGGSIGADFGDPGSTFWVELPLL
jgi:two-component system, chemotaxis family, CheB/CheR fusion protein